MQCSPGALTLVNYLALNTHGVFAVVVVVFPETVCCHREGHENVHGLRIWG